MATNPVSQRVQEALVILERLQAPANVLNEPSAVALLALAAIEPSASWSDASTPMLGVTEIINFGKRRYGCDLGAEVRDTLQNVTLPFFKSRRLVLLNPDNPRRTATSRYCVHQLDQLAIALVKSFGTDSFPSALAELMNGTTEASVSLDHEAPHESIWITLSSGAKVSLVRDHLGELTRSLLEVFCAKFAPGGKILYVADAPCDHLLRQRDRLIAFGCSLDTPGNLPDLVVHDTRKNRLVLVDASDGEQSIDEARRHELEVKFAHSSRRLVMVTAFSSRVDLVRTIDQISSETRAWVAECPSRLIQFNSGKNSSLG